MHFWPIVLAAISDTITVFGTATIPVVLNIAILLFPPGAWVFKWIRAPKPFGWRVHMKSSLMSQFALGPAAKRHWKELVYFSVVILMLAGNVISEAYKLGIESVKPDIDRIVAKGADINKVTSDLADAKRKLEISDIDLQSANRRIQALEERLAKGTKAGGPLPPTVSPPNSVPPVKLAFSLAPIDKGGTPVTDITAPIDANGSVTFTIYVINQSGSTASNGMIWFRICQGCTYTYGPELFYSPPSAAVKTETTYSFQRLFTTTQIVAKVGIAPPVGIQEFQVGLKYACDNCIDTDFERATLHIKR
jgi:hypothetical protein